MNTKEFAKKYNVKRSWVADRCRDGMIFLATKTLRWEIEETATLPPCTANRAIMILENILECKNGNKVFVIQKGNEKRDFETLKYLQYWGFITIIDDIDELSDVNITNRGIKLIEKNNKDNKFSNLIVHVKGGINIGVVHLETEVECERGNVENLDKRDNQKIGHSKNSILQR